MLRLLPSACRTMYMVRMRSKGATDARETMPATPPAISLHYHEALRILLLLPLQKS